MLTKQEVQHIAKLARLKLSGQETERMQKDLSQVLDYFKLLEQIDVAGIEPSFYPTDLKSVTREDKAEENKETACILLEEAPGKQGRYVKVKEVLR